MDLFSEKTFRSKLDHGAGGIVQASEGGSKRNSQGLSRSYTPPKGLNNF